MPGPQRGGQGNAIALSATYYNPDYICYKGCNRTTAKALPLNLV